MKRRSDFLAHRVYKIGRFGLDPVISEEISSDQISAEVIDHTCDENVKKYSIQKKNHMSYQFILSTQLITYL